MVHRDPLPPLPPPPFSRHVWQRAADERKARDEAHRLVVLGAAFHALEELWHLYRWEEAFLFGSIVRPGRFSQSSDVDVAVGGLDGSAHYRLVAELSSRLGREVDVVLLEECRFAQRIRERGHPWKREARGTS